MRSIVDEREEVARLLSFVQAPLDDSISVPEIIATFFSLGFCIWYFFKKHWLANNVLGLAFAVQAIENISIGSTVTGCVLLCGLFFYDIFWVFFTPVMVSPMAVAFVKEDPLMQQGRSL